MVLTLSAITLVALILEMTMFFAVKPTKEERELLNLFILKMI